MCCGSRVGCHGISVRVSERKQEDRAHRLRICISLQECSGKVRLCLTYRLPVIL